MVAGRLTEPDCREGDLLDGFPRTIGQAEQLRDRLAAAGRHLDAVLEFDVDEDELIRRLAERRARVDGEWLVRQDDRPETVRHRLKVYRELTAPLSGFYADAGLLRQIDAGADVSTVTARALAALGRPFRRTAQPPSDGEARAP